MSGGRPAAPCWPIGRSASCSKGSLVWDGGKYFFFRLFADGFFFVLFFRLGLAAIVLPASRHWRYHRAGHFHFEKIKRARTGPNTHRARRATI
jgi:hypothetical protein